MFDDPQYCPVCEDETLVPSHFEDEPWECCSPYCTASPYYDEDQALRSLIWRLVR